VAQARIRDGGWNSVHIVRGDATQPGVEDATFDAVYASMSLSAMPDPKSTLDAAYRTLRPGGRIVVLDARPFQEFPWTLLNPVIVPLSRWTTNWFPEENILNALDSQFRTTRVTVFNGGTIFIATARRPTQKGNPE
jgi:phosphatidylethanolamine/phosphatidyl-N-methylethanolamine N-methyltransferase